MNDAWYYGALYVLQVAGLFVTGIGLRLVGRRLRRHHPTLWGRLGEPTALRTSNPTTGMNLSEFVLRGRYREIDDPVLRRMSRLTAVAAWVVSLGLLITVLLSLFGW